MDSEECEQRIKDATDISKIGECWCCSPLEAEHKSISRYARGVQYICGIAWKFIVESAAWKGGF